MRKRQVLNTITTIKFIIQIIHIDDSANKNMWNTK